MPQGAHKTALYAFGFNGGQSLFPNPQFTTTESAESNDKTLTPASIIDGVISLCLPYTSWCDYICRWHCALYCIEFFLSWFTGRSKKQITNSQRLTHSDSVVTSNTHTTTNRKCQYAGIKNLTTKLLSLIEDRIGPDSSFFDRPLNDGLKGIITNKPSSPTLVTLLASDLEIESGNPASQDYEVKDYHIKHISMTNGEHISLAATIPNSSSETQTETGQGLLFQLPSLPSLISFLKDPTAYPTAPFTLPDFHGTWTRLVSNVITTTGLTSTGHVYTWTSDPRFAFCLGRPLSDSLDPKTPSVIEYLSEQRITKIASGGLITAAVSLEGELFLWGQEAPGSKGKFSVLSGQKKSGSPCTGTPQVPDNSQNQNAHYTSPVHPWEAGPGPPDPDPEKENGADQYIKCVELEIDGKPACVSDVAVGNGHVLVAASVRSGGGKVKRAVFAAGQGRDGQLGLGGAPEFVSEFTEVDFFAKRRVKGLAAAGWSSWVVAETYL